MSAWMITDAHADLLATTYRQLIDTRADAQEIGRAILDQNARSIRALYEDRHGAAAEAEAQAAAYVYRRWQGNETREFLNKQAACALYQACETGDYAETPGGRALQALVDATGGDECKWCDGDPWGIDQHPPATTLAAHVSEFCAIARRERKREEIAEEIALRTAAPLRGNRGGAMLAQHDASDLALFGEHHAPRHIRRQRRHGARVDRAIEVVAMPRLRGPGGAGQGAQLSALSTMTLNSSPLTSIFLQPWHLKPLPGGAQRSASRSLMSALATASSQAETGEGFVGRL